MMATARRIAKNVAWYTLGTLVQKTLALALIFALTRLLGRDGFGIYSLVFSTTSVFFVFADLGVTTYVVREIAKDRSKAGVLIGNSLLLKLPYMLFAFSLMLASVFLLKYDSFTLLLIAIAGISMLLDSVSGLFRSVFFAFERFEFDMAVGIISKLFLVLLSLYVLFTGHGLVALMVATVAYSLVLLALSVFSSRKFAVPVISLGKIPLKTIFLGAIPFCLITAFSSIYFNIDVMIIAFFHQGTPSFLAYYGAALRLVSTLGMVAVAFTSSVFPVMTRFFSAKNSSTKILLEKSIYYLMVIHVPISFGATILAPKIVGLLFGQQFVPGANALQLLIWFSLISFINVVFLNNLYSINKERLALLALGSSLAINVLLNILLVPQYNYIGSAIGSIISESVFFFIAYAAISKHLHKVNFLSIFPKPLFAALIMSAVLLAIPEINVIAAIAAGAAAYFAVFWLVRGFSESDMQIIRRVLARD